MDFADEKKYRERKELEAIVEKLDRDLDAIVVEGYGDKEVMRKLGFTGKIFLSAERKNELLAEDIGRGSEKVGILTDFDEHGKEENRKLRQLLQQKVDIVYSARQEFGKKLTSKGRRTIEEIKPLFRSKNEKFIDAAFDRIFFKD